MEIINYENGLKLIKPKTYADNRGLFTETYNQNRYKEIGLVDFVQDNCSFSNAGVLRGLHNQKNCHKLITCLYGRIMDVAVDIRTGEYKIVELSGENKWQFYLTDNFLHGFYAYEPSVVSYKVSVGHNTADEISVRWDSVGIEWYNINPILSDKDKNAKMFKELYGWHD